MDWEGVFAGQQERLFGLAYRMLGSVAEAQDVLQNAWLRVHTQHGVDNPAGYLTTVVTRLCLDVLGSARVRREQHVGPWLPEPLWMDAAPTPEQHAQHGQNITMAFLQVLETLSPLERAAFILREVLGEDVAVVAAALGREEPAVRQLVHRAREHIQGGRTRYHAPLAQAQEVAAAFLGAVAGGDVTALLAVLAPDVVVMTDSGGKVRAARRVVQGAQDVARLMVGVTRKHMPPGAQAEFAVFNGEPGVLMRDQGVVVMVLVLETDGTHVHTVRLVLNPDKLRHLQGTPQQ